MRNKQLHNEANARYRNKNRDKLKEYNRQYNLKHKDRMKELKAEYYYKNKIKAYLNNKKWKESHPDLVRGYVLKKFNLTIAQYGELLRKQDFKCAICGTLQSELDRPLLVDHDHKTGKNRGLLCHNCNVAIGHFRDSVDILYKAIEYLKRG